MTDQEFQAFIESALDELQIKQSVLNAQYALGQWSRWWLDQEAEILQFFDRNQKLAIEASVINIGSFAQKSDSWIWAWSNQLTPISQKEKSLPLRELSRITGFDLFESEGTIKVDEAMAWELAAISVKHLGAMGCYRALGSNSLQIFLAITAIHIIQNQH